MKTILLLVLSIPVSCIVAISFMFLYKTHGAGLKKRFFRKKRSKRTGQKQVHHKDESIGNVYNRLNLYFENEKPYLDSNLTISDVAKKLYTNKVYVSQAVNRYAGLNFCQYVNRYRVFYAMDLLRAKPGLRISEVAYMSGFNSTASINISFRFFVHTTPGDWSRGIRRSSSPEIPPRPSKRRSPSK